MKNFSELYSKVLETYIEKFAVLEKNCGVESLENIVEEISLNDLINLNYNSYLLYNYTECNNGNLTDFPKSQVKKLELHLFSLIGELRNAIDPLYFLYYPEIKEKMYLLRDIAMRER
ncbi:MAG: hypothetical protein ACQETL_18435 [Bacteroidota bacterium]